MSEKIIRWGILSTAEIARKNWLAIRNTGNSIVAAVASRDAERSRKFIAECQRAAPFAVVPQALGSYEELLASREVDAVYIPLPTGLRKKWVIRAAKAGKHVVCEKPCAISAEDLRAMIDACRKNGVQFMDGVMFMHSRRLEKIRETLDNGTSIGEIKRIASGFTFCAPPAFFKGNIRSQSSLEPHGCLGDLGWYCIRFALWTMNWQLPKRVSGRLLAAHKSKGGAAGVPTEFSGELFFDSGVSAGFYTSFLTQNQQWAHVSGAKGHLLVSDFVLPYFGSEAAFEVTNAAYKINGCEFNMEPHARRVAVQEYSNSHVNAQETHLFRNFAEQIRSRKLNRLWPEMALKTQQVMDACYESARCEGRPVKVK